MMNKELSCTMSGKGLWVARNGRVKKALQRKTKVSRKVPVQERLSQLKEKLVKELLFAERSPY